MENEELQTNEQVAEAEAEKEEKRLSEKKQNKVPEADFVFDADAAEFWLSKSYARVKNVLRSVRFEPADMEISQLSFLLSLAAASIRGRYTVRKQQFRGVLYVPRVLSQSPELSHMEKGSRVGEYVEFFKPE
jgi:hypothetical protein